MRSEQNCKKTAAKSALARVLWCLLFILPFTLPAAAKHLVGGSVTYKFIEYKNGLYHFQITVDAFRDCIDPSAPRLDSRIIIGIYEHTSTGNKKLYDTLSIAISTLETVEPVSGGSSCSFVPQTCLQHGQYIADINLVPSIYGYDLIYERCCRNVMVNVPQNSGYNYYAFIAPTYFRNTSPAFNDVPVPYICLYDSVTLNFSATEPDGDSITYKLAWPYSGAGGGNPSPLPPDSFSEPDNVMYNVGPGGYSYLTPFGKSGYAKIGASNGLLTVYAVKTGNYVVAVDYYEYRNGKLIDSTRRDVQFIVITCPNNPAPTRQALNGSMSTDYYIQAGQTIDFKFAFSDPNKDAIKLTALGNIFSKKPNPAVLTVLKQTDTFSITADVTWKTLCTDASSKPYSFIVKVQDNGCPPKITYQTLNIYVLPPATPSSIYGPQTACGLGDTFTYAATPGKNTRLKWKAENGTIIGADDKDSVKIRWSPTTTLAKIKLVYISAEGCLSDTLTETIKIFPKPPKTVMTGPTEVCLNKPNTYEVAQATYTSFIWKYGDGKLLADSGRKITLAWNRTGPAYVKVREVDGNGCFSDSLKLDINVGTPVSDSIYGPASVCPNSKNMDYVVNTQKGSTFTWLISGGVQASGGNSYHIKVNWGNKGAGMVRAVEKTTAGCIGDTVSLPVIIDYLLHTPPIQGDSEVCELTPGKEYQVINSNNSTYRWSISGGTIVSGQGSYKIAVNWSKAGTGTVTTQETAYDSVNHEQCTGLPISLNVHLDSLPLTSAISGNNKTCAKNRLNFMVTGFKGSVYNWAIDNPELIIDNQGADSVSIYFPKPGSFILSVQEISKDSCPGTVQTKPITIDTIPNTGEIQGPVDVCTPNLDRIVYSVKGAARSTFVWTVLGGSIMSGAGTNQIMVNWANPDSGLVSVTETSEFGCAGPLKTLGVRIDSLTLVMDLVSTLRSDDTKTEVRWHTLRGEFLTGDINIYRSTALVHDGYRLIATLPAAANMYVDKNVSTHSLAYYYKISAVNSCGATVWSAPHHSILLEDTHKDNDSNVFLYWNRYTGWPEGVAGYWIYKSIDKDTTLHYYNATTDSTLLVYTDLVGYEQCFRVGAVRNNASGMVSWSNNICLDLDPILWIPKAFTPNDDMTNNKWKIYASNFKSFQVDIYNRWGEHVFASNNPATMWDGRFKGADCPEGVYLYMVQVGGARKNIYRSGTLNLLK